MKTIRSFIAINIPAKIRNRLKKIQDELKKSNVALRLVRPENIHITLKFLGNVPVESINDIQDAINESISGFRIFLVSFEKIGVFPNPEYPRVIWVGIERGAEELFLLNTIEELKNIRVGEMLAEEICLMGSILKPQGAQYNTLKTFLLE